MGDIKVLVLISYWDIEGDFNNNFIARHKKIVDPNANSEAVQFFESFTQHLSSFVLLYKPPRVEWEGGFPADLSAHMPPNNNKTPRKELGCRITDLGKTFLDYIGITENMLDLFRN